MSSSPKNVTTKVTLNEILEASGSDSRRLGLNSTMLPDENQFGDKH